MVIVLRTLLSVLLLATVLAPTLARADDDDAALGERRLALFEAACPASVASGFSGVDGFDRMDERDKAMLNNIALRACTCAGHRLREFPLADVTRVMEGEALKTIAEGCIADEMKSDFGAICQVLFRQAAPSEDEDAAIRVCGCAQARADVTSSDALTRLLAGEEGGVYGMLSRCAVDSSPASPEDPSR